MPNPLLEQLVLGEIQGKNQAIHIYDDIVWKIRTGFLTLLLGGWAILLKGIVENKLAEASPEYRPLVGALLIFSFAFAGGAWWIDRAYLRRKFRVIQALDDLFDDVARSGGDVTNISSHHLKVAGDNPKVKFDPEWYREAWHSELAIYFSPLVLLILGIVMVVK
jgi:hypothetical protein